MGLRTKAREYIGVNLSSDYADVESILKDYISDSARRNELKSIIENYVEFVRKQLDRKLLDMQTLFELGKELNSTLHLSDLLSIILFTLMGQFRISDVALFVVQNEKELRLLDKKGFAKFDSFPFSNAILSLLSKVNNPVEVDELKHGELKDFSDVLEVMSENEIALISPMKNKEKVVGLIAVGYKDEREPYSEEEKSFFYTLSSFAGIAVENASLYEALESANERLSRKLNELSTLYEISKVINSSDDYQGVLNLITETITTGFGVKKALLFAFVNEKALIKKVIGLDEALQGKDIRLNEEEERLFNENRAGIIMNKKRFENILDVTSYYLLMPLISGGIKIGGIYIFSFEKYQIDNSALELESLFSVIASQIAPPLALTSFIQEANSHVQNPFGMLIEFVKKEIEKAKKFGVSLILMVVKLPFLAQWVEKYGAGSSVERMNTLNNLLSQIVPSTAHILRYSFNKVVLIIPESFDQNIDDIEKDILYAVSNAFQNKENVLTEAEIKYQSCTDTEEDAVALLSRLES